jgi:L-amino acid N-acyltransferase YncA
MDLQIPDIRDAGPGDAAAIAAVYNVHVRATIVTFELDAVTDTDMCERIGRVQAAGLPWLVLECAGGVRGFAHAAPWKLRPAYARTAETSIYLDDAVVGHGHGRRLYAALLARLREAGMHTAIGGAALPNPASAALHASLGFEAVGVFREVGHKLGRWIDVGYWQLPLDGA